MHYFDSMIINSFIGCPYAYSHVHGLFFFNGFLLGLGFKNSIKKENVTCY